MHKSPGAAGLVLLSGGHQAVENKTVGLLHHLLIGLVVWPPLPTGPRPLWLCLGKPGFKSSGQKADNAQCPHSSVQVAPSSDRQIWNQCQGPTAAAGRADVIVSTVTWREIERWDGSCSSLCENNQHKKLIATLGDTKPYRQNLPHLHTAQSSYGLKDGTWCQCHAHVNGGKKRYRDEDVSNLYFSYQQGLELLSNNHRHLRTPD